jgi:hypothetical protein
MDERFHQTLLAFLTATALLAGMCSNAMAADDKKLTPQQEKMKKKCNADASAKALNGDERKGFMSECLKADKK